MTFEIQPEEIVKVTQDPVKTFYDSLKSEATKLQYDKRLRKVLCQFLRPILEGAEASLLTTQGEIETAIDESATLPTEMIVKQIAYLEAFEEVIHKQIF